MLSTFLTIWFLQVAAMIVPGPNFLFISHVSASDGRRKGVYAAVGIAIGAAIWASATVLGIGALFRAAPALRLLLQVGGSIYLLYVAVLLWRSPLGPAAIFDTTALMRGALRAGILTNLSNAKSALFFSSVFSAALPDNPSGLTMLGAVVMMAFNSFWWHALVAFVFSSDAIRSRYSRQRDLLARAGGTVLGAFGVALLWNSLREVRARL